MDGAHSLAKLFGAPAVAVLFAGIALAVEAFKSTPGAFSSTRAPHVIGFVIAAVCLVVSAFFGFFGYVLLRLRVLVEHAAPVGAFDELAAWDEHVPGGLST